MLAFLCRYSCSKRELKKELTLLSFLSRCLSASPAKAPEQQNDLSKSFIAEPSASPCLSSKLFRKHLCMCLKGRLIIVLFTVQIWGGGIDYAHSSPLFDSYPIYSVQASHTLNLGYFDGFGQFSTYRNSEPIATVFYGDSLIMGQRWWLLLSMALSPPPYPSSVERHPAALFLLPSSFPTLISLAYFCCQLRGKGIINYIVLTNYICG